MKRFLLFSLTSVTAYSLFVGGCSSSGGNSGAIACSDAGTCEGSLVCQNGVCVQPGTGGTGTGGTGTGGVATGGGPSGGYGGLPSGGSGGLPSGGTGGGPDGGSGGLPSGGSGGLPSGGTGGGTGCGALGFNTPACDTCAQNYCCNEMLSCDTGSQCLNLLACLQQNNCFTATDPDACANTYCSAYTDGQTDLLAVDTCVSNNCASDCGG